MAILLLNPKSFKVLDKITGAAAAFSVRRLGMNYFGAAIRVRRSSDNAEQDVGFNANGDLDTTSLLAFVGAVNGFVRTWYDQSGNGLHFINTTPANQPRIVLNGVVETENGKPTVVGTGTSFMVSGTGANWNRTTLNGTNVILCKRRDVLTSYRGIYGHSLPFASMDLGAQLGFYRVSQRTTPSTLDTAATIGNSSTFSMISVQSSAAFFNVFANGDLSFSQTPVSPTPISDPASGLYLFSRTDAGEFVGAISEAIFFKDVSISRSSLQVIERNLAKYYALQIGH